MAEELEGLDVGLLAAKIQRCITFQLIALKMLAYLHNNQCFECHDNSLQMSNKLGHSNKHHQNQDTFVRNIH